MVNILETVTHYTTESPCKTASEMEDICCETTGALQCCVEVEREWGGYTKEEAIERLGIVLDENGRDAQGRYVVVEFEPRTNPCGERVTSYDTSPGDCCEAVDDLAWDIASSVEVVAPSSSGKIYFSGGRSVAAVSVSGQGFWLDGGHSVKSGVASGGVVTIYTDATACGSVTVGIDDGCSAAEASARATLGKWELLSIGRDVDCLVSGGAGEYVPLSSSHYYLVATRGRYRTTQEMNCDGGWYTGDCPHVRCTGDLLSCMANYAGDCESTVIAGQNRYKCHWVRSTKNEEWVC